MNAVTDRAVPGRLAAVLAVLSVACFWLLPFSPVVAIGAVSMTRGETGWPRRLAVTGATLCVAYTLVMALLVVRLALQVRW